MQANKKKIKENRLIESAERVFGKIGFKNAKMEDIALDAGITKVTLYSYFQSKENLYMAVTHNALTQLNASFQRIIKIKNRDSGLDSALSLLENFMVFCENNYLYSEALLEYFALVRSTSSGKDRAKMTEATKDSYYYEEIQKIHNEPFKLIVSEMQRGINDGSIGKDIDPMFHTLQSWISVIGYVKINSASGKNATPLFNVDLHEIKKYNLQLVKNTLAAKS